MSPEELVAAQVKIDPPEEQRVDPNDRVFSDIQDDELADHLFALWQYGVLEAEWDEDASETRYALNEFGAALCEADFVGLYIRACESDVDLNDPAPALEVSSR